ncbi:hypothetical protein QEN19_001201 [Hanseniaspora menglaensis]
MKSFNWKLFAYVITPVVIFIFSYHIRSDNAHQSSLNNKSIWDEAHFGKFAKYYITETLYHDVHPPLGKMINFFTLKYIGGFPVNTEYNFSNGSVYPDEVNFVKIRQCQWIMNALTNVFVYYTGLALYDYIFALFLSLLYTLEIGNILLGKFILLDTILIMFTIKSFMSLCYLNKNKNSKKTEWFWSFILGCDLGCVLSVKWVGLFIYLSTGCYVIYSLLDKFYKYGVTKTIKTTAMFAINLIIVPSLIYMFSFKLHFSILKKAGPDDGNFPIDLQLNLIENKILPDDSVFLNNDVSYYSIITLRSNSLYPTLLHSHQQTYPVGSRQRQVTGYGHLDSNNDWIIYPPRDLLESADKLIRNNSVIRIVHKNLETNLHTHEVSSAVDFESYEVSGYGSLTVGDFKDNWIIELVNEIESDNVYPVLSKFRIKNIAMDCYLSVSGNILPNWGFKQNEIVCKPFDKVHKISPLNSFIQEKIPSLKWALVDRSSEWTIELHSKHLDTDEALLIPKAFAKPEQNFLENFAIVNYKMQKSNSALVPDDDKYDSLASSPFYWPFNYKGLRLNGWGQSKEDIRYYLIYGVYQCWGGSLCLFLTLLLGVLKVASLNRCKTASDSKTNVAEASVAVNSVIFWLPVLCYFAHYLPFIIMARVTYVHHYLPCIFFKTVIICNVLSLITQKLHNKYVRNIFIVVNFVAVIYTYWLFKSFAQGMSGLSLDYKYLELLSSWNIV